MRTHSAQSRVETSGRLGEVAANVSNYMRAARAGLQVAGKVSADYQR